MKRRQFLTAMGLSGASLYLSSTLPRRLAMGADHGPQKRILFVFTSHGTVYERWKLRPGGMPESADFEFTLNPLSSADFSEALRPLHAHRDRVLVLDGLTPFTCYTDPYPSDLHDRGHAAAMTGAHAKLVAGLPLANGPSIDQVIAGSLARTDRHRSLEVAINPWPRPVHYTAPGQSLLAEQEPSRVWERLFGLSRGSSIDEEGSVVEGQSSALDALGRRYQRLAEKLSGSDRQKIDAHRQLIRELEQRITGLAGLQCPSVDQPEEAIEDYSLGFTSLVQLLTAGLSCDVMRVATLVLGDLPNELIGLEPEAGHFHVQFAHAVLGNDAHAERSRQIMTNYTARHATQVGELMDTLARVPEGGGTLLDNTTIVWLGELGNGAHGFDPWPVIIAGGANCPFRLGRYIRWAPTTAAPTQPWPTGLHPTDYRFRTAGVPHQKLLVSLAQAFGVDTDTVGLAETRAADGTTVNLRGPLDRLR